MCLRPGRPETPQRFWRTAKLEDQTHWARGSIEVHAQSPPKKFKRVGQHVVFLL